MGFRLVLLLVFLYGGKCEVKQDLGGEWSLKDETEEYKDLSATVPGGIYTDLMSPSNKILGNIYAGFNDIEYKWVARYNWTYSTTFQVQEDLTKRDVINLVLEGVDTFATILINDVKVGTTENMFVRYIFEITNTLKAGVNTITLKFDSPITVSEELAKKQAEDYAVPPDCVPDSYKGECHVNFIRKIPASFSWDWGPAFPSVGIWKDIYLEAFYVTTIRYVVAEVIDSGDNWLLSIDTYFAPKTTGITGKLDVSLQTKREPIQTSSEVILGEPNEHGEIFVTTNVTVPKSSVDLWWPNGYGKQPLYTLNVTFTNDKESSTSQKKIGFRKIEIMQDELDSGLAFYFKVNNVPIYAMGVNVIPLDILPEESYKRETVDRLLAAVAEYTEMNMLRVWGGGVYESDYFYEMADKYGLMIWQDFVFASAMYPANAEFLSNVQREVNHQVKRIQSHASLAVWGGNNENEGNLASNHFNTADNFDVYKADYIKLYIDTVRDEMRRATKNANFVNSSPTNGIQTDKEGYVASDPGSNFYGDKHYYNNKKDSLDESIFPTPRFSSEYGYQSLPSVTSWLTVANSSVLNLNSDFMKHRQHHPDGNDPLKNLIEFQMELPSEDNEYYDEAVIYYTQIIQAMSVKTETEHYRRFMGRFDDQGQGNTMGALFWQLNDVWVAPSWASIDYTGRWKMLHNFVPNFFSHELVTGHYNKDSKKLEIYHMLNKPNVDGEKWINLTVYSWESFTPLNVTQLIGEFEPLVATLVASYDVDQFLSDSGCGAADVAKYNCFVHIFGGKDGTVLTPSNYFFPSKFKEAKLKNSNVEIISVDMIDAKGLRFHVWVKADAPSLFVWLDPHDIKGHFLENGFIQHSLVTTVTFVADSPTTSEDLKQALTVTHLRDPKYFISRK